MHKTTQQKVKVEADPSNRKYKQGSKSYHERKNLQKQVERTKQTTEKSRDENVSLLEKICSLHLEQGITIILIRSALFMTISIIVLANCT